MYDQYIYILFGTIVTKLVTMIPQKISLTKNETALLFSLEKTEKEVFTIDDAVEILSNISRGFVKKVLYSLVKKKRIERVKRGTYVLIPAKAGLEAQWGIDKFEILKTLKHKYYVSFWTALAYWGLTDQIIITVYVCYPKKKNSFKYSEIRYRFVRTLKKHFFGYVEREGINVATIERLILDCLSHPEYCGGISEVSKAILEAQDQLDWKKLLKYLKKFNVSAVERRLFFILDYIDLKDNVVYKYLSKKKFKGFRLLEPVRSKNKGKYNSKFGLRININPESLIEEIL